MSREWSLIKSQIAAAARFSTQPEKIPVVFRRTLHHVSLMQASNPTRKNEVGTGFELMQTYHCYQIGNVQQKDSSPRLKSTTVVSFWATMSSRVVMLTSAEGKERRQAASPSLPPGTSMLIRELRCLHTLIIARIDVVNVVSRFSLGDHLLEEGGHCTKLALRSYQAFLQTPLRPAFGQLYDIHTALCASSHA